MADVDAKGTVITWGGTTIGKITDFSGPSEKVDTIEHTDLSDTDRQYTGGLRDGGELSLTVDLDPVETGLAAFLVSLRSNPVGSAAVTITFPDAGTTTASFTGIPTSFSPGGSVGDKLTAQIGIKITGAVAWA